MRLLILSCSATKHPTPELLPALDRYDGPFWRTLRAHLRTRHADNLSVYALSAEYGLIPASSPILDYNRRMDAARAKALRPKIAAMLECLADQGHCYAATLICGGQHYQAALLDPLSVRLGPISRTSGGIGAQLGQLKRWLITD